MLKLLYPVNAETEMILVVIWLINMFISAVFNVYIPGGSQSVIKD